MDKLIDRIKAHRAAPDVYDRADFLDMEARILADAKIIKAAEELARTVDRIRCGDDQLDALQAYHEAVAERAAVAEGRG